MTPAGDCERLTLTWTNKRYLASSHEILRSDLHGCPTLAVTRGVTCGASEFSQLKQIKGTETSHLSMTVKFCAKLVQAIGERKSFVFTWKDGIKQPRLSMIRINVMGIQMLGFPRKSKRPPCQGLRLQDPRCCW